MLVEDGNIRADNLRVEWVKLGGGGGGGSRTDRGGKLYRMFGSENICGNLFQGCVLVFRRLDEWLNGFFRKVLGFDV